jgi:bromodomain and PHD finger-containing protein 1
MDEEDNLWLKFINEHRRNNENCKDDIDQEEFEFLMDRLEKESYFQQANTQQQQQQHRLSLNKSSDSTAEDALCCICLDGECVNSNLILFCDMCNLAVHQECYGVPYIPEGQWLCRKCIQSPSAPVSCILCPNKYGAFKQTDKGQWVHVICAIWIPEVHFANTVFLEPIIGIESIDKARYRLKCSICRKSHVGACIQCDKQNCYTAFHVTCAQQAGLYMNIKEEVVEEETTPPKKNRKSTSNQNQTANSSSSSAVEVRKCAYCNIHTPLDVLSPETRREIERSGNPNSAEYEEALSRAQKIRMKKVRKMLKERRNAPPVVCLPTIPQNKIQELKEEVEIENKDSFFERLMAYWLLKRHSRNGVPILRRLQMSSSVRKNKNQNNNNNKNNQDSDTNNEDLNDEISKSDKEAAKKLIQQSKEQMATLRKFRQDLEKSRLLLEQVRKRERIKRDLVRVDQVITLYEINAFNGVFLQRILEIFVDFDKNMTFTQPVDPLAVPTYYEIIKEPMDFSKMQTKINELYYKNLEQFEDDVRLIISNCMKFNPKNTYFYKEAHRFREKVS